MALVKMTLADTVDMMVSDDYKERFKAEYYQTKYRFEKLRDMILKAQAGKLPFTPSCSLEWLREQRDVMGHYLHCMEVRAVYEDIEL